MNKRLLIIIFIVFIIASVNMLGCVNENSSQIIRNLSSENEKIRDEAKEQLSNRKFTKKELPLIYEAISREYDDDNNSYFSTRSKLLSILWDVNDNRTASFIEQIYPNLPNNSDIKFSALRALSQINTEESVETLTRLLIQYKPDLGYSYYPLLVPFYENAQNAHILFPQLFHLLEIDGYKYNIYALAVHLRDNKAISPALFKESRGQIMSDYMMVQAKRREIKKDSEEYIELMDLTAVIVDAMGSFPNDSEIIKILEDSLNDDFPRTSFFAVASLLRFGRSIPNSHIIKLANNPEMRLYLYEKLNEMNHEDLFPQKYLTQFHFAESDMVRWLCFPTEFGKPPEKIELIETKNILDGRVYLFKYFYPGDDNGWMIGMSGPQPKNEKQYVTSGYLTFSHFNKVDDMTIKQHFDSFLR